MNRIESPHRDLATTMRQSQARQRRIAGEARYLKQVRHRRLSKFVQFVLPLMFMVTAGIIAAAALFIIGSTP